MTPSRKTNRTGEIKAWLELEIGEGRLLPGARIDEQALSERFDVSKTPVREALLQLSSMGLVDMRQRRGAMVTQLSIRQIVAMLEVMSELEGMAARLAARRMSSADRDELSRLHSESRSAVEAEDFLRYAVANRHLHEAIYDGCRNEYLASRIREIRYRLRAYLRYPFQRTGGMKRSFDEHGVILAAILEGDGEEADRAMQVHISTGGHALSDVVAEAPEPADNLHG